MPTTIKYICLSDTHFGDPNSLLTALGHDGETRPLEPGPVLTQLATCLGTLIPPGHEPPTLILNGDVLELALTTTEQALMSFMQFIRLIAPPPEAGKRWLCNRIIYLMGNHDHHLWETARETQYRNYLEDKKQQLFSNLAHKLPAPYHATNMFEGGNTVSPPSDLLETAIGLWPWLRDHSLPITVFYPNYGLFDERARRCVAFHHGQFIEPIYHLMSIARCMAFQGQDPTHPTGGDGKKEWDLRNTQVWDIETENFAWIDFLWSTLGRSGAVGKAMDSIYQIFPDKLARKRLIDNLSKELPEHIDIPYVPGTWTERRLLKTIFNALADQINSTGRGKKDSGQKDALDEMVGAYVNGPLQQQMKGEFRSRQLLDGDDLPLDDVTFVYGHTHKPAWYGKDVAGKVGLQQVFNTGGWVVHSSKIRSGHGATLVVVDEHSNTAAIRIFQDLGQANDYTAEIQGTGPLADYLRGRLGSGFAAWNKLGELIHQSMDHRRANIRKNIEAWQKWGKN